MRRLSTVSTATLGFVAAALGIAAGAPAARADGVFAGIGPVAPQTAAGEPFGCPYFSRWVYISPGATAPYNTEAPYTSDALGADGPVDGAFADGVSIELTADGRAVRVLIDEPAAPDTSIVLTRIFVQTGASWTLFSNEAMRSDGTVLDPPGDAAIDHAFACYEPMAAPPVVIPEVPWSVALPLSGAAALGAVLALRSRRRGVAPSGTSAA